MITYSTSRNNHVCFIFNRNRTTFAGTWQWLEIHQNTFAAQRTCLVAANASAPL